MEGEDFYDGLPRGFEAVPVQGKIQRFEHRADVVRILSKAPDLDSIPDGIKVEMDWMGALHGVVEDSCVR